MATPAQGAAPDNMAVQAPTIKVEKVGEYIHTVPDPSDPQKTIVVKVCKLTITTWNKAGEKVNAVIAINKNRPDGYQRTSTSANEDDKGTLMLVDQTAIRLNAGEPPLIIRVDNLTHGGSDQVTVEAPPKTERHEPPKGFWGQITGLLAGLRGETP